MLSEPPWGEYLKYSWEQYQHHTDWFLRHRDFGIRTLGAILAAQLAALGFYERLSLFTLAVASVVLLVVGFLVARMAILSCTRAYRATLEHSALITKITTRLGFAEPGGDGAGLFSGDTSFHPPRYVEDAKRYKTTEEYVEANLCKRTTSYQAARWTIWSMWLGAVGVALAAIIGKVA